MILFIFAESVLTQWHFLFIILKWFKLVRNFCENAANLFTVDWKIKNNRSNLRSFIWNRVGLMTSGVFVAVKLTALTRCSADASAHLRVGVQRQELLLGVQQLAGVCDVDRRFLLVTCQHPYLQTGFAKWSYSLRHAVLQPVLDAGRSCRREWTLYHHEAFSNT